MNKIRFEWDENKATINLRKHNISFEEASTAFAYIDAILFNDPYHSEQEAHVLLLGMSALANLLIVCHCVRENESVIRIISARKATKTESKQYIEIQKGW